MSRPAAIAEGPARSCDRARTRQPSHRSTTRVVLAALRVVLGFHFLNWAFVDKLFGFGFATVPEKAWINGGSPTTGYPVRGGGPVRRRVQRDRRRRLGRLAVHVPACLGIGVALILGIGMRIATVSAVIDALA